MTQTITLPQTLILTLRSAKSVTVLTGAGISAESGIPTFRDSQTGLWAQYDPHQLATPQAFADNPKLVLDWYRWRRDLVNQSAPNAGHLALAEMEKQLPRFTLITQNVDGLHRAAGSHNVVELHGNLQRLRCPLEGTIYSPWPEEDLPRCESCGELLRPDVVWFGESLPHEAIKEAAEVSMHCDVFLTIGTSGMVEPAASLPYHALRANIPVVEINPVPTPLTVYATYHFPYPSGLFLPKLVKAVWP